MPSLSLQNLSKIQSKQAHHRCIQQRAALHPIRHQSITCSKQRSCKRKLKKESQHRYPSCNLQCIFHERLSRSFIQCDPLTVIVDWNQIPKGKRENPYTASRFAVITGRWTEEIYRAIMRLGFFDRLTKVNTAKLTGLWKKDSRMENYSAHSIKRGAIKFIFEKKQTGLVIPLMPIKSTSQTRNGKPADIRNDVKICRVGQVAGPLPEHKPHNPTFVIPRTARRLMQNFTRKSKTTRLPSTEEERATPLHVKEVGTIDVQEVKRMMTDGTRRRFEEVWDLTFNPCRQGTHQSHQYKKSHRESCLQSQHARRLVEAGVATQTSSPGILESIPFTILEERITGTRQRFILWTKEANLMMHELGYKPKVPLEHIAQYLSQVTRETSSQWDLKTGFYARFPYLSALGNISHPRMSKGSGLS